MKLDGKKYGKPSVKLRGLLGIQKCFKRFLAHSESVEHIRKSLDTGTIQMCGKTMKVYKYRDITLRFKCGDVPIRLYSAKITKKTPIIIYLHGGSWIGGSIDTHDNVCRKLCRNTNFIVISVGYRLAPEYPFPTALKDVYNVLRWAYDNGKNFSGDNKKIFLVGDSAGGNLAASMSQYISKKNSPQILAQVLIYPCTNIYDTESESWKCLGEEVFLKKEDSERFVAMYVKNKEERRNPYVSPLLATTFNNLPKTLIITAEFDPLRDEGQEYYRLLKKKNVDVEHIFVKGVHHGFITMDRLFHEADETIAKIAVYLKKIANYV